MTVEQKWDLLWRAACRVSAAIERCDQIVYGAVQWRAEQDIANLINEARALKSAVDTISPDKE